MSKLSSFCFGGFVCNRRKKNDRNFLFGCRWSCGSRMTESCETSRLNFRVRSFSSNGGSCPPDMHVKMTGDCVGRDDETLFSTSNAHSKTHHVSVLTRAVSWGCLLANLPRVVGAHLCLFVIAWTQCLKKPAARPINNFLVIACNST